MRLLNSILLLSLLPFCVAKDTVPTFLLDYDHVLANLYLGRNPFTKISSPQFADIMQDAIKQFAVVILFIEDTFCTEDVSIKDDKGSPYVNLREEMMKNKVRYIPNVGTPFKVVTRLMRPSIKNIFVLKPGQLFHSTKNMKYFYVSFNDDNNESRAEALRRHDILIQHVYESTRKTSNGSVLGIYTGKVNPVTVPTYQRGAAASSDPNGPLERGLVLRSRSALYRFVGLTIDSGDRTRRSFFDAYDAFDPEDAEAGSDSADPTTDSSLSSTVKVGEYQLEFFFLLQSTRWRLDRIKLYEATEWVGDHNLSTYIGAPYGSSYICDEPLVFYNTRDKSAMVIPQYQIQPFRKEDIPESNSAPAAEAEAAADGGEGEAAERRAKVAHGKSGKSRREGEEEPAGDSPDPGPSVDASTLEFGPAVQCTPYFTIGILTGLLVTGLCLTILMTGVFCLYHCETNSRFDDPQAKQIVVPAGD